MRVAAVFARSFIHADGALFVRALKALRDNKVTVSIVLCFGGSDVDASKGWVIGCPIESRPTHQRTQRRVEISHRNPHGRWRFVFIYHQGLMGTSLKQTVVEDHFFLVRCQRVSIIARRRMI